MKLTMRIGAAIGIAALGACSQAGQDNSANVDSNAAAMGEETVLPPDEGNSDTLGNQLDQLNQDTLNATTETSNEGNAN